MNRTQAEAAASELARKDSAAAFAAGIALLKADYPELLLGPAAILAERHPGDARIHQMLGLAARAAGDGPVAYTAFARAAALASHDALIAHSHARAALEAGRTAVALFEHAQRLAPQDGSVLQGLAAALVAEGRSGEAVAFLGQILDAQPMWLEGQRTLAHIRGQFGQDAAAAIGAAVARQPRNPDLHRERIATLLHARRLSDAAAAVAEAQQALGEQDWLTLLQAHAASELNDIAAADRAFAARPSPGDAGAVSLHARHALRAGRAAEAAAVIEPWLERDAGHQLWPYAALAWRISGDPRADWLEGDDVLVGVYDLADRLGDLPGLAEALRALHVTQTPPLDQSVRGGTQTDGNLLLRDDPAIQRLRQVLRDAVAAHVARLPEPRTGHPTLIERREPQRVAGAWSVRLQGAGFHADHVHTQGWLSSALYIALPDSVTAANDASGHAGWLSLGECREVVPGLQPVRLVEPKPGRLVLFPSTMWHGTRPFPEGERLTVAFDIAPPRQN